MASNITNNQTAAVHFYLDDEKGKKPSNKEISCLSRRSLSWSSSSSSSSAPSFVRSAYQKRCSFTRKCAALVKEQRSRFYIMRRCITMLICWREYNDS